MVVNDSTWKVLFVEYGITYITHFIVVSNTDLQWQNTGKNLMIVFTSVFTSFIESICRGTLVYFLDTINLSSFST